jgi:hypothetical integral membrane protein (TIGR02206 family)
MDKFFARDYTGTPFFFMGVAHLAVLLAIILLNLYLLRFKSKDEATRTKVRWSMAIILWANEIGWHVWNHAVGQWNVQTMIPLHVCSVLVWLGGYMLVSKNYIIYELTYFLGIAGALQALLTPDLGLYGFPHYRFFQTFISHGLIVTSAIYMTTVEGFRPTWKSILRVTVIANIYMALVFFLNQAIGSNYMYINRKPDTASLLDMLPAWPGYIPYVELIGLFMFLLLYLPFIIKDKRMRTQVA